MSRNEEFHGAASRHRMEIVGVRGGVVVGCAHCGWSGKGPVEGVYPYRGDAVYDYDAHVAEAKGLEKPARYDESGRPLRKYKK